MLTAHPPSRTTHRSTPRGPESSRPGAAFQPSRSRAGSRRRQRALRVLKCPRSRLTLLLGEHQTLAVPLATRDRPATAVPCGRRPRPSTDGRRFHTLGRSRRNPTRRSLAEAVGTEPNCRVVVPDHSARRLVDRVMACGVAVPPWLRAVAVQRRSSLARRGQRQSGATRTTSRRRRRVRDVDVDGVIPVLARAVREVEAAGQRGIMPSSARTKFQVVALLVREERARVNADETYSDAYRAEQLRRLDGIATILAKTAARDTSLLALLAEDAVVSDTAASLKRDLLISAGVEPTPDALTIIEPRAVGAGTERRVVPQSVVSRQLANPFLAPDFTSAAPREPRMRRLAGWELIGPLLRSFEYAAAGASACKSLPEPSPVRAPGGLELMPHQAQLVAAAAAGHRTFLLADEPGLGKTAQALLAAQAADAYPLLAVVPNVVKTNWAREAGIWTPQRTATVIHGDGDTIDGFADIVVVNYEVLDRHVGWLGDLGFRSMVVDEAHFIKNKKSQRSRNVLRLSERIRTRAARPLLMALTGTPLINDIEDFRAIWQFLGWIDETGPRAELTESLEETGLTPADPGFYAAARACVIDLGIVRRRKVDVAADIPDRRIADLPVELDGAVGRSIRD